MSDPNKPKRTISKLGRLFGVLSSNLQLSEGKPKSNVTLESLQASAANASNSASTANLAAQSPPPSSAAANLPTFVAENNRNHPTDHPTQEDDVLSPLPNERSPTASPMVGFSLSPMNSHLLVDLQHPQPRSGFAGLSAGSNSDSKSPGNSMLASQAPATNMRSPPVSRLLSVNSHTVKRKNTVSSASAASVKPNKLNPVSRALSVKKPGMGGTLSPSASSTNLPQAVQKPRFKMYEDGSHEHNLRAAKRQEKLTNMLKDLLGAKKLRDEAKSAVPNILLPNGADQKQPEKPPTLFAGLVSQVKNNTSPYHNAGDLLDPMSKQDSRSFVEKYGRCQEVIGRGSFGVVRISHKKDGNSHEEVLYAVKEFKKRPSESEKKYSRRLTSEFCISSSLKHINIIDTLDLLKDAKGDYCEVMEFCSGGDLYTLIIAAGKLEYAEADCFFKQLIRGVNYMHDMGVAHRDLKPENLLLTQQGILKITDFGNGECFRMAWENNIQLSEGVCGSSPYIAPEEFTQEEFDPRCVDIWACGVIYMAMRTGRQLWQLANPKKDEFFEEYLVKRKDASGYEPIESLKRARCRNVIYSILDPIPERRINGKQILNSEWGREIKVCAAGEGREDNESKAASPPP